MTMDYSPWVEREIWPFLKVAVSPKPERSHPPKLVCMHVTSTPICMIFLSQYRSIKFFDDHGLYSPWVEREIWPFLKVAVSPKLKRSRPLKFVCMHVTSTPICMIFLSQYRSIKFFDDHGLYSPWVEREIWPFLKVAVSPKLKRSRPLKFVCMHVTSTPICMIFLSQFRSIKFFDDHGL